MLTEYINAIMLRAVITPPSDAPLHTGTINGIPGVLATGSDLEECRLELRREVERWILFRVARHLALPEIDGQAVTFQEVQNRDTLIGRIHSLESQLQGLVGEVEPLRADRPAARRLKGALKTANSYWALFSFGSALLVIIIVFFKFEVDPFEEYRRIRINRDTATIYRRLGDDYLESSELKAAENAYQAALKINPNSLEAAHGLFKAQVFNPLEGERYKRPEAVWARISKIRELPESEYHADLFAGIQHRAEERFPEARQHFFQAIQRNQNYLGGHLELGASLLEDAECFSLENSLTLFRRAQAVKSTALTNYHLGHCHLLLGDFDAAIKSLETTQAISPRVDTAYLLGEAYRFNFDPKSLAQAVRYHRYAIDIVSNEKNEVEDFTSSRTVYNYLPTKPGDQATQKTSVFAYSFKQHEILLRFALSLDFVMLSQFTQAEEEFEAALKLAPSVDYNTFAGHRIYSMLGFLGKQLTPQQTASLAKQYERLQELISGQKALTK